MTSNELSDLIQKEIPNLTALRRELHQNPGLGYEEFYASRVVQAELEKLAVSFKPGLGGGTGVVAHLPGEASEAIGLRADMDALPILERNTFAHVSKVPGKMHACGHDGHTAILIGTARVLSEIAKREPLPQPVKLFFQPAEEGGGGAAKLIEDGCLEGVRSVFGIHGDPHVSLGTYTTRAGALMASASTFRITIKGLSGHAAMPHRSIDPLVAGAACVLGVQTIVSRSVDPLQSAVVSITYFGAGRSDLTNVIPEYAELLGTIRTLDQSVEDVVQERLAEIAISTARAHGCSAEIVLNPIYPGYPVTYNAVEAVEELKATLKDIVTDIPPLMGAEDFSFYCQKVPSAMFRVGLRPGEEPIPSVHNDRFDFNDDAIAPGVEAFCRIALAGRVN